MPAALVRVEHDRDTRRIGSNVELLAFFSHSRKGAGVPCAPQLGIWCWQRLHSREGAPGLHGVRSLCVVTGLPNPPLTTGSFPATILSRWWPATIVLRRAQRRSVETWGRNSS